MKKFSTVILFIVVEFVTVYHAHRVIIEWGLDNRHPIIASFGNILVIPMLMVINHYIFKLYETIKVNREGRV